MFSQVSVCPGVGGGYLWSHVLLGGVSIPGTGSHRRWVLCPLGWVCPGGGWISSMGGYSPVAGPGDEVSGR